MGSDPKMRGPFTRKGSRVYRGDGALFVTVMSAAEGDMLLSLLNAPAPTDALKDEREAFERWATTRPRRYDITYSTLGGYADDSTDEVWIGWKARASASGLSRPGEGDWVLVPREPTEAMYRAGCIAIHKKMRAEVDDAYRLGDKIIIARTKMRLRWAAMLNATPARSTAPSALTESEAIDIACSAYNGDKTHSENCAAIAKALLARAFPDSTKETK